jgi:hypothetical protein
VDIQAVVEVAVGQDNFNLFILKYEIF